MRKLSIAFGALLILPLAEALVSQSCLSAELTAICKDRAGKLITLQDLTTGSVYGSAGYSRLRIPVSDIKAIRSAGQSNDFKLTTLSGKSYTLTLHGKLTDQWQYGAADVAISDCESIKFSGHTTSLPSAEPPTPPGGSISRLAVGTTQPVTVYNLRFKGDYNTTYDAVPIFYDSAFIMVPMVYLKELTLNPDGGVSLLFDDDRELFATFLRGSFGTSFLGTTVIGDYTADFELPLKYFEMNPDPYHPVPDAPVALRFISQDKQSKFSWDEILLGDKLATGLTAAIRTKKGHRLQLQKVSLCTVAGLNSQHYTFHSAPSVNDLALEFEVGAVSTRIPIEQVAQLTLIGTPDSHVQHEVTIRPQNGEQFRAKIYLGGITVTEMTAHSPLHLQGLLAGIGWARIPVSFVDTVTFEQKR